MKKYRFKGINSYTEEDKDVFFERENVVQEIYKKSYFEQITIVHSKTGTGKTSLLKAGFMPILKHRNEILPFYITIENFIKNSKFLLSEIIAKKIETKVPKNSFLDKIITPNESLWYLFKRIEATDDKTLLVILDQAENIFSYPEKERLHLKNELYTLLFEQIPLNFRNEVEGIFKKDPELLTEKGLKKLYEKINIKFIISIRSDKLNQLDFFEDKIHNISENIIEIPQFTATQVKSIFKRTSTFVPKYNIDNTFISEPFVISSKLLDKIIIFLTKNNTKSIEAYQFQIIGSELEKIAKNSNLKVVDSSIIDEISIIYKGYYESIIEKIENSRQQISARKFIENELIFEYEHRKLTIYEGVAKQKYELNKDTLDFLLDNQLIITTINDEDERFFELSHDALITPVLLAKEKRIHQEIRIEDELNKKKILEEETRTQKEKTIRNRKIAIIFSVLFFITFLIGIMAINEKNKAEKNEKLANSTLYSSFAFQHLETNPTISLRYAEKAYNTDNQNIIAQKSFFEAFYKTNIFYEQIANIEHNYNRAFLSPDGSKTLLISNNKFILTNKYGNLLFKKNTEKVILSAQFSHNNQYFIISTDSIATLYDTTGNKIVEIKENSLIRHSAISPDNAYIITCNTNNNLVLWDIKGNKIQTFIGHTDEVLFADFSDDGQYIISTSFDNSIIIWNLQGKIIAKHTYIIEYQFQSSIIDFAGFGPDNKYIFFVMNDYFHSNYAIKVWDWKNDEILATINYFEKNINTAYFANNEEILISTADKNIYLTNFKTHKTKKLIGHSDNVFDARYCKNNNTITSISADKTIKSWKLFENNSIFSDYSNPDIIAYPFDATICALYVDSKFEILSTIGNVLFSEDTKSPITDINFSENDNYISTIFEDSTVVIRGKSGRILNTINFDENIIFSKINEKNKRIAVATNSKIVIYNLGIVQKYKIDLDSITAIDVNFDKNRIIYSNSSEVKIINLKNEEIEKLNIENVCKIKYISQNKTLFLATDNEIIILDKNYKILYKIQTPNCIKSDISSLGNMILWCDSQNNCYLLNQKGELLYNFKHTNTILNAQFSANEKTLLTTTIDIDGKIDVHTRFVSIDNILEYINTIKLFGNVYKLCDKE